MLISLRLANTSTVDSLALFFEKARHFRPEDVSTEMAVVMWAGLVIQAGIVPVTRLFGWRVSSEALLCVGSFAGIGHITITGLVVDKFWLIALSPVGCLSFAGSAAATAIVSGEDVPLEDQGTLLGVLAALSSVAGAVGPLATAPLLTASQHWRASLAGVPYLLLAVLLLPALVLSGRLYCHRRKVDTPSETLCRGVCEDLVR